MNQGEHSDGDDRAPRDRRPRVVVTTDPELDDLNSMLRLLLYSNEIQIEGLVYASSQFHYSGDASAGVAPHRWPRPGDRLHIDQAVDQYEKVYDVLRRHADGYPEPDALRSLIAHGNTAICGDFSSDTPGSELIRRVLLDDRPGPVFLGLWAGPSTVARALKAIEEQWSDSPEWPALHARISAKAIITGFGEQDPSFSEYIRPHWPDIEFRQVATSAWGYGARRSVLPEHQVYLSPEWTREHVSSVGPMGATYRVWGDGKQMAPDDHEDYFGLSGLTKEQLEAMGYRVWLPVQERGAWISEGDSSNFALLIGNGLRSWEHPSYGGWGGRQAASARDPRTWTNASVCDRAPDGTWREDYAAARWFEDIQLDFAARLRWTVAPSYSDANHAPMVRVTDGALDRDVKPGEVVPLVAMVTDPDGDAVAATWWHYAEAGTYPGGVSLSGPLAEDGDDASATEVRWSVTVPEDARPGDTIHLILQVRDDGTPPMTSYQRVILTVSH